MANESNSSVVRVHKNTDFTIMSNHHLRNQKLSLKAIGLMSKILGLPCDWNYSIAGLVKICKEGETAVRAIRLQISRAIIKLKEDTIFHLAYGQRLDMMRILFIFRLELTN